MMDTAAEKCGIEKALVSPHKLRRAFGTALYAAGTDLLQIKDLLGHENIQTTTLYVQTNEKQLRDAVTVLPDVIGLAVVAQPARPIR